MTGDWLRRLLPGSRCACGDAGLGLGLGLRAAPVDGDRACSPGGRGDSRSGRESIPSIRASAKESQERRGRREGSAGAAAARGEGASSLRRAMDSAAPHRRHNDSANEGHCSRMGACMHAAAAAALLSAPPSPRASANTPRRTLIDEQRCSETLFPTSTIGVRSSADPVARSESAQCRAPALARPLCTAVTMHCTAMGAARRTAVRAHAMWQCAARCGPLCTRCPCARRRVSFDGAWG